MNKRRCWQCYFKTFKDAVLCAAGLLMIIGICYNINIIKIVWPIEHQNCEFELKGLKFLISIITIFMAIVGFGVAWGVMKITEVGIKEAEEKAEKMAMKKIDDVLANFMIVKNSEPEFIKDGPFISPNTNKTEPNNEGLE